MGLLIWPRDARSAYVSITRTDTQSHRADLSLLYFGWVCTPARVDELQTCGLLQPGSSSGFQRQSCSGHFSAGGAPAHVRLHTLHAVHPGTITHPIHCHTPALSSAPPCPFAALQIQQATFVVKLSSMTLTVVVGPAAGRNCGLALQHLLCYSGCVRSLGDRPHILCEGTWLYSSGPPMASPGAAYDRRDRRIACRGGL